MALALFGALSPGEAWVGVGAATVFIGVALLSPRLVGPLASVVGRPLERLRGVSGRLARENSVRNPGRTATTAAALMIGLALVSFVTVFAAGPQGLDRRGDRRGRSPPTCCSATRTASPTSRLLEPEGRGAVDGRRDRARPTATPRPRSRARTATASLSLIDPTTVNDVFDFDWREGGPETAAGARPHRRGRRRELGRRPRTWRSATPSPSPQPSGREDRLHGHAATFKDNTDFFGDYVASDVNADGLRRGRQRDQRVHQAGRRRRRRRRARARSRRSSTRPSPRPRSRTARS